MIPNFNDLEFLKKLSNWVQWFAIGLVFLGGLLQFSKYLIEVRIDNIKDGLLRDQENKIKYLENEAQLNKLTIRDFESILKIKFSGNWISKPYPKQILSPVNLFYYIDIQSTLNNSSIKFYATQPYQFKTLGENNAEFISRQAVRKDEFPLGKSINDLELFDKIQVHIPFIMYGQIKESKIIIEYIEITFIVNGEKRDTLRYDCSFETPIIKHGNQGYANPYILLSKRAFVDLLNLK